MMDICLCGIAREDCDYHKPAPVVSQVPVYDVSGTCFIKGVTNFTRQNFFDACQVIWIKDRTEDFILKIWVPLFNHLNHEGILDTSYIFTSNVPSSVVCTLQGTPIVTEAIFPNSSIYDSLIYHLDGRKIILRTREC